MVLSARSGIARAAIHSNAWAVHDAFYDWCLLSGPQGLCANVLSDKYLSDARDLHGGLASVIHSLADLFEPILLSNIVFSRCDLSWLNHPHLGLARLRAPELLVARPGIPIVHEVARVNRQCPLETR